MANQLTNPVYTSDPVVMQRIDYFGVDSKLMQANLVINGYSADDEVVASVRETISILDENGLSVIPDELYDQVKALLYAIATGAGLLEPGEQV